MPIPQELQDIKQWSHSFDVNDLKRPKHSHYAPDDSLPYQKAVAIAKRDRLSFGFYCTLKDNLVIGDIDHIAEPNDPSSLSPAITNILVNKGVYSEISPSGEGIRFVLKLPKNEDKSELRGKVFYTRTPLSDKREAQINFGPPWLRFTGNETTYSSGAVGVVSLAELDEAFAVKYKADDVLGAALEGVPQVTPLSTATSDDKLPTLQEMRAAIKNIPLDKSPRIVRAYEKVFGQAYSHYDFWLRIIMGVHDFAMKTGTGMDCLMEVIKWSQSDPESYSGEDDVVTKWTSLADGIENVSFHTVFAVAYANTLIWPRVKPLTKQQQAAGITAREPINSEYVNFKALVQFYNIELHRDVHSPAKMYLSGDEDIMNRFFKSMDTTYYYEKYRGVFDSKSLTASLHIMSQELGFTGLTHIHIQQHIKNWAYEMSNTLDLVKLYFDTPFEDLPASYQDNREFLDISTVDYMFDCLVVDHLTADTKREDKLYKKYYKSWLMGMVRNLYWGNDMHMNNCVLLLSGREQVRKTSHFRYMLPKFMRDERIAFTTHGFSNESSVRDLIKLASGNSLLVWDEIEQHLTAETESSFKQIIDSTPTKFIDKYATIETSYKPIAMYGATSNQREFKLSDTGSRRLFHIPVSWVHTDKLDNVCWWKIVNDLRDEIANHKGDEPPWLLTAEELDYQAGLHSKVTAKSGLEIVIREIYNFQSPSIFPPRVDVLPGLAPLKSPNFLTTKKVVDAINIHTNGKVNVPRAQLTRILHNLCGMWTSTTKSTRIFIKPSLKVHRGQATYGGQHKLWVLPTAVNPYDD